MNATILEAEFAAKQLKEIMNPMQLEIIRSMCHGEEGQFFRGMMVEMANLFQGMPKTYEQDGKGDDAIASLHYFRGGSDFYITEKDMGDGQHQAFGLANLGYGAELGYISIVELLENNFELDLYFTPCTLREIKEAA